jgi:O-antigen ligase
VTFKRDKNLSAQATRDSVELRPVLAAVAWQMFLDHPLAGRGFGQYEREHVYYLSDRTTDLPLERGRHFVQHNALLALLTETGLAGAGLFALLLILWARDAWHVWASRAAPLVMRQQGLLFLAYLGAWFPNAMFHDTGMITMVNMFLFFVAGVTEGVLAQMAGSQPALSTAPTWSCRPRPRLPA